VQAQCTGVLHPGSADKQHGRPWNFFRANYSMQDRGTTHSTTDIHPSPNAAVNPNQGVSRRHGTSQLPACDATVWTRPHKCSCWTADARCNIRSKLMSRRAIRLLMDLCYDHNHVDVPSRVCIGLADYMGRGVATCVGSLPLARLLSLICDRKYATDNNFAPIRDQHSHQPSHSTQAR